MPDQGAYIPRSCAAQWGVHDARTFDNMRSRSLWFLSETYVVFSRVWFVPDTIRQPGRLRRTVKKGIRYGFNADL